VAGNAYGILLTTLVAGLGLFLGSYIVYIIGTKFNHLKLFKKKKIKKVLKNIKKYENILLWIRILSYNPSDIISYAAGIIKTDNKKFIKISIITSFVRSFLLALLGTYITNIQSIISIFSILVISAIIGYSIAYKK